MRSQDLVIIQITFSNPRNSTQKQALYQRLPLWAVYPQRRQLSPRVRVFVDWVVAIYGECFS
ncbi:tautomerase family protein [Halomonas coralii]|nr:tautomerase family protein [Modicisalibacter sp. R2A 31.J]MBZ9573425.1 tautomerase family protein [Modicisalibacter sp. MOD 31.J]